LLPLFAGAAALAIGLLLRNVVDRFLEKAIHAVTTSAKQSFMAVAFLFLFYQRHVSLTATPA